MELDLDLDLDLGGAREGSSGCVLLIVALGLAVKPVQHACDYRGGSHGQQMDQKVCEETATTRPELPAQEHDVERKRGGTRREADGAKAGRGMRLRIVATYSSWWHLWRGSVQFPLGFW